jgi:hypothetical protein
MGEATGRIIGWTFLAALAFVTLRGSLPTYLSLLGI